MVRHEISYNENKKNQLTRRQDTQKFNKPRSINHQHNQSIMEFPSLIPLFLTTLFLTHQSKGEIVNDDSSTVIFIDSPAHEYFRPNVETNSMSVKEVAAAVSVLLGLAPVDISPATSAKLNEILLPNPFDKPRHVFMLEIGLIQDSQAAIYADNAAFRSAFKSKVISSEGGAEIELPDTEEVTFFSLDGSNDMTISDKEISDFASGIGGNFESTYGELTMPLPSRSKLSLDISKKADRKFTTGLIHQFENLRIILEMKQVSSGSKSNSAELVGGYFDGIKALQEVYGSEGIAQQGMELLLTIVSRVFDSLQAEHKGEAVAIVLFGEAHSSQPKRMLDVTFASRPTARFLEEAKPSLNSTIVEEIVLVRLTVAWASGILLLIATIIGAYLLLYMPVTKDTLLYSNVKID